MDVKAKRVRQDIVEGCLLAQQARIRELEAKLGVEHDARPGADRDN